ARGGGPGRHRHRRIPRTRPRRDPAAPRLDHARRGHDHRVARLRRPARLTAAADPERPRRPTLRAGGPAAVTAVFAALLGWLLAETRDGSVLGLAERLTTSIQTCWPFIIAVALRRTRRPRPGPATGGNGGLTDGATAPARARGRRQDR